MKMEKKKKAYLLKDWPPNETFPEMGLLTSSVSSSNDIIGRGQKFAEMWPSWRKHV